MMDVMGFDDPNPPYRIIGAEHESILIEKTENWKKIEGRHDKYDIYFDFYECKSSPSRTFGDRKTKPEYKDKIPNELLHKDIEIIEEHLRTL